MRSDPSDGRPSLPPTAAVTSPASDATPRRLTISISQRTLWLAAGVALVALMVTLALTQGVEFYLILWVGVLTCCLMLDDIRTRSKLIEVGGVTAVVMMAATSVINRKVWESTSTP